MPSVGTDSVKITVRLCLRYNSPDGKDNEPMDIDLNQIEVIHNLEKKRFETTIDGKLSKLDYLQNGNNFVITHVGVHPDLRGQGVAGKIVETGIEYARENSFRVVPMCSYAAAYIRRHPEYAELTRQTGDE